MSFWTSFADRISQDLRLVSGSCSYTSSAVWPHVQQNNRLAVIAAAGLSGTIVMILRVHLRSLADLCPTFCCRLCFVSPGFVCTLAATCAPLCTTAVALPSLLAVGSWYRFLWSLSVPVLSWPDHFSAGYAACPLVSCVDWQYSVTACVTAQLLALKHYAFTSWYRYSVRFVCWVVA